jgi:predicted Zn-dependent peptidase
MSTRTDGLNHEGHKGTKITKNSLWSLVLGAVCVVAATVAAAFPQQAPDRSKPPALGPVPALKLPPVEKRTLSNGLQVWIMGVHKVPTVHVELTVRAGIAADPPGKFGLASLTADMLDEGAGTRNALEIADAVDFLGAELSATGDVDASYVDLHVPVARLADALPIMADVVARPTFPESELKRLREERLASLLETQDDPAQLIRAAFPRLVFGPTHRYGTPSVGTAASLKGIMTADLKAFYAAHYRPGDAVLIVAGDVTAGAIIPMLERALGGWKGPAAVKVPPAGDAPQLTARHVFLIDKPGAAQSQIRIGWVGVPRSTPDYFALRVLNTILGEAFTSRLNNNLREVHGYAYGASSRFDMRLSAGAFYAAAGVQTDKTSEALKEFFNELTRIHEPVPTEELEKAKNYLALQLPRSFETTRSTANVLAQAFVYDLPADYYTTYGDRVRAVTAADVKRAADKYIQPDRFAVVIIGDRKVIEPGIQTLNLGPITVVEPSEILK